MRVKSFFLIFLGSLLLYLSACQENEDGVTLVLTEEIIYVSGEIVRVTGRVISPGEINVSSHGFEISTDESFTDAIVVDLGTRSVPGRFIGEYQSLQNETEYFLRSFMIVDGQAFYGDVFPFSTLGVQVDNFYPQYTFAGREVTIEGRNFGNNTRVFFGAQESTDVRIDFESIITARIPTPIDGDFNVNISVVSGGDTVVAGFQNFEYVLGKWEEVSVFTEKPRLDQYVSFTQDDNLYFGLGNSRNVSNQTIWSYNVSNDQWGTIPYNGPAYQNASGFEGGFMGGQIFTINGVFATNDSWEFNDSGVLEASISLPLNITEPIVYKINDDYYLIGGINASGGDNLNYYQYDTENSEWVYLGMLEFATNNQYPSFYQDGSIYVTNIEENELWRYDTVSNSWNFHISYPVEMLPNGISEIIDGHFYIGLFENSREIFELPPSSSEWRVKNFYNGFEREINLAQFARNGKIYVIKSAEFFGDGLTVWSFDPFDY